MCRLILAFSAREESVVVFQQPSHSVRFLVPFFPQSSVQFGEIAVFSSVCSCENAHMSLRCSRGSFFIFFVPSCPAPKMNSYTMRHGEI